MHLFLYAENGYPSATDTPIDLLKSHTTSLI